MQIRYIVLFLCSVFLLNSQSTVTLTLPTKAEDTVNKDKPFGYLGANSVGKLDFSKINTPPIASNIQNGLMSLADHQLLFNAQPKLSYSFIPENPANKCARGGYSGIDANGKACGFISWTTQLINIPLPLVQLIAGLDVNGNVLPSKLPPPIPGPIGLTGSTGLQGPIGLTGSIGPQGPIGQTGSQGPAGQNGQNGIDGTPGGPIGPKGDPGQDGANGINGIDGQTGPQGPIGQTGPAGPQGLIGPTGQTGATGSQGNTGVTGPIGKTGAVGQIGPTGANAVSSLYTVILTPAPIPAFSCLDQTVSAVGPVACPLCAAITNVTPPTALGNLSLQGWATTVQNQIIFHFCNVSAIPVTPPTGLYKFKVIQ